MTNDDANLGMCVYVFTTDGGQGKVKNHFASK